MVAPKVASDRLVDLGVIHQMKVVLVLVLVGCAFGIGMKGHHDPECGEDANSEIVLKNSNGSV